MQVGTARSAHVIRSSDKFPKFRSNPEGIVSPKNGYRVCVPGRSRYGQLVLLKQTGRLRFSGTELPRTGNPEFLSANPSIDQEPAVAVDGHFAFPTLWGQGWFWFV